MRLLYIALRVDITGDGASIYAMNNIMAFASQLQTDVLTLKAPKSQQGIQYLKDKGCNTITVEEEPYNRGVAYIQLLKRGHNLYHESNRLRQVLYQKLQEESYAYIVLETYSAYLIPGIRELSPASKIILNQHNYEYANHLEYIQYRIKKPLKKMLYRIANYRYRIAEHTGLKRADAVIAISHRDKQLFDKLTGYKTPSYVLSPALPLVQTKIHYRPFGTNLLFLGMMDWYPNIQGLMHFIEKIFYPLVKINPAYHLHVVGKNPVEEIKQFQSTAITITGEVSSVDQFIQMCDLLIVPNTLGGGVKIKIMEAIQKGIPLLVSPQSAIGYEGVIDFFIAKDDQEFISRILSYPKEVERYRTALVKAQEEMKAKRYANEATVRQLLSDLLYSEQRVNTF